jgi:RNA-directed DNA polymerase
MCKRWLAAPLQHPDGTLQQRDRGTPQGSAVSPVLANLFMHYAFDSWMAREFPAVEFERYADDAVVHCVSRAAGPQVLAAIAERMEQVGLRLHPDKTKIVYCKDGNRRGSYEHTSFTFLGYTFRPAGARTRRRDVHLVRARDQQGGPQRRSAVRSAAGGCTAHRPDDLTSSPMDQPDRARAGCSTTAGSTGRRCIPSCSASTPT